MQRGRERQPAAAGIRVFVYGTLKPGQRNWNRLLSGRVHRFQTARIRGRLYTLRLGFPAAVPADDWIQGYLLGLPDSELLDRIDALEGFRPDRPARHNRYRRAVTPCFSPTGAPLGRAYAYFMDTDTAEALGGRPLLDGIWRPSPAPQRAQVRR